MEKLISNEWVMHTKSSDKLPTCISRIFTNKAFSGFFSDPPPGPFDVYRQPIQFRENVAKGRQILSGPPIQLFEKKYERIFEGEALTESWREEARQRVFIIVRNYKKSIFDHLLKIKR